MGSDLTFQFGAMDQNVAKMITDLAGQVGRLESAGRRAGRTFGQVGETMGTSMKFLATGSREAAMGLARLGTAGGALGLIAFGWMGAAKAAKEYAEVSVEAQHQLDVTDLKIKRLWQDIGASAPGAVSPWKWLQAQAANQIGADPDIQKQRFVAAEKLLRLEQDIALARDDGERAFLRSLHQETAEFEKQRLHRLAMSKSGQLLDIDRGQLDRIAGESHRARIDAIYKAENERTGKALRDGQERERREKEAAEEKARREREREFSDREALNYAVREARIDSLRAQGKDREARVEQLRLDTIRKIEEVKRREGATDEERRDAIAAISGAESDQLAAIMGEEEGSRLHRSRTGAIAPGLANQSLIGQVFGGGEGKQVPESKGEAKREVERILKVLLQIANNTSHSGATWQ